MPRGSGTAAPLRPQRDTAADRDSTGTLHRHPDGANGTRSENGMKSRCEYGFLAPEEPAGNPSTAGTQVSGDGHRATMGTDDPGQRATETRDGTGQRALLVRSTPEEDNREQRSPKQRPPV